MSTRRDFLGRTLAGVAAAASAAGHQVRAAGELAWPRPIGFQVYTVRDQYAKDPKGTLKKVGAIGYREVDLGALPPGLSVATLKSDLAAASIKPVSDYLELPKTADDWKKSVDEAHALGASYIVTGATDHLDADGWKRLTDLFNECGKLSANAGLQFAYHNHIREFEPQGDTCGYEIMLKGGDPKLVKFEMDIFWMTYSGADVLDYWRRYPGRFPLLHVKDLRKGITVNPREFPPDDGPNPFVPVGQGRVDWPKIFAHVGQAGTKHIFVEQDRCEGSPFDAMKTSFDYLKSLRLS